MKRSNVIVALIAWTLFVGFVGYRLGFEQNPCSALEIILSYPKTQ